MPASTHPPQHSAPHRLRQQPGRRSIRTVAIVSLGCPKNLIDSEKMLGLLAESGLVPTTEESQADAIIVNTCGFLEASKQEGLEEIARAGAFKTSGVCKRLVVAGCLVQRHRAKILDHCPQVDAMIGVFDRDRIVDAVTGPPETDPPPAETDGPGPVYSSIAPNAVVAKRHRQIDANGYFEDDTARLRLTPRHYAYLRISEGCNQNCAFCTIPSIRGKLRSKPVERIERELVELIDDGAFEINLIGQDTTSYGADIGDTGGLVGLLESINETAARHCPPPGAWIRLMYAYPSCFTDAMIDAIARLEHVVKYIDMPLQHINDQVLASMRRGTGRRMIESLLDKLRSRVDGIAIRTTLITGFPGETHAQHKELVRFVEDFKFDAMGVFAYSPEPGTPAGSMHNSGQAVGQRVVEQRLEELMLAQQRVALERNAQIAARADEIDVLIDTAALSDDDRGGGGEPLRYAGRARFQAPQIDGVVHVVNPQPLVPGELVRCRVNGYQDYDLVASPVTAGPVCTLPILDSCSAPPAG